MGPYQRTPKQVARAIRYSGLGVRSVGPVGDFLDDTEVPPWRMMIVKVVQMHKKPLMRWDKDSKIGISGAR